MAILRLVVAWLIMAALPLQGVAAASMLFCDQAAHSTVAKPAAHDHAAHGHGVQGDHASHSHDADESQGGSGLVDDGHACTICASCCNLVALSETPTLNQDSDPAVSQPLEGPSRVITRHAPAPDKPPRA